MTIKHLKPRSCKNSRLWLFDFIFGDDESEDGELEDMIIMDMLDEDDEV